jgi:hypothetical protein
MNEATSGADPVPLKERNKARKGRLHKVWLMQSVLQCTGQSGKPEHKRGDELTCVVRLRSVLTSLLPIFRHQCLTWGEGRFDAAPSSLCQIRRSLAPLSPQTHSQTCLVARTSPKTSQNRPMVPTHHAHSPLVHVALVHGLVGGAAVIDGAAWVRRAYSL